MSASTKKTKPEAQSSSLLPTAIGFGIVGFYILFTLLPNSNSLMVKWPWVFLWQFGLMLGPIALLLQVWHQSFRKLGHRLDWLTGAWCIALILSAAFAPFWHQALWYSWAALCGIAFLYVLNGWLTSSQRVYRLLTAQGSLAVVFSVSSLVPWFFQTVRPYQKTLQELRSYGIERSFDLQILSLRNWHPIGHQNYVAGYLLLVLPLLVGLAFSRKGWQRFFWLGGFLISAATLYSTASRGGWIGFVVGLLVFLSLSVFQYPQWRKSLLFTGLVSFIGLTLWAASSDRIRTLFTALSSQGSGGELTYRLITNTTGWNIGLDHPILGAGLGSVTLLYQKYRPAWAGREAELTYQLHSTPAQLWAELGIAGAILTIISLCAVAFLSLRWCKNKPHLDSNSIPSPVTIGIISGLAGYSVYALTDYQLDNICISGTLLIFIATLIFENRPALEVHAAEAQHDYKSNKRIALVGAGILAALSLWLYPIHRAWMLSSQGFLALQQDDFSSFVTYLEKAHELAPWEPYYAYQLAWNIGELAFNSEDAQQQEVLRQESVAWFEKANLISPNQEFGYSNLGWLQVNSDPQAATQNFLKAMQLVPGKRGASFALGYSLLRQGKSEEALEAMVTELTQQPVFITSPIWQSPELAAFYPKALASYEAKLNQQLAGAYAEVSKAYFYQILGSLNWWQGDFDKARTAFKGVPTPLNEAILVLADTAPGENTEVFINEQIAIGNALTAWQDSKNKRSLLRSSVILSTPTNYSLNSSYVERISIELENGIDQSDNFHDWITGKVQPRKKRNQRLGFGTISRHIDGPIPSDFSTKLENQFEEILLKSLFPMAPRF